VAYFHYKTLNKGQEIQVSLKEGFDLSRWGDLETFYRKEIKAGCLNWSLDLSRLEQVSSPMLGMLVGLNTMLSTRGGVLRAIVRRGSRLAQLLTICKLNLIIQIKEI
jgi:anti-anti-sigma regulatory factor